MSRSALALAVAAAVALGACHDVNRTTSVPRGVNASTILYQEPTGLSAEPARADRGPVAPNANTAAPGTDASVAFAKKTDESASGLPANDAHLAVQAEEAAAKAPDTASADAAKKQVLAQAATESLNGAVEPGRDTEQNSPRHGQLSNEEEKNQMPKGGQTNNHSTPALEKDSGR
jgi:hypothetical protein